MKKSLIIFAAALAAVTIAGCSSTKEVEKTSVQKKEQATVIGAEGVARPDWVMQGKQSADGIYASGFAKMSTLQNSLKAARVNARAELANTVQASVKSAVTTYAEDTGIADDNLNYLEEATVQRTDAILQGSTQADYWVGQDETVYVLMYLPYNAVVPEVNNIVKEYSEDKQSKVTVEKVAEAVEKYQLLEK
ncbi:MAG: LPP20 family lipoprotein [Treponema sp.]|nr:LPP20 family lipoprotein [Treponema sp.]